MQTFVMDSFGFDMNLICGLNLTGSDDMTVTIVKPSKEVLTKSLVALNIVTPLTGAVKFPIITGDLDEEGVYDIILNDDTGTKDVKSMPSTFVVLKGLA